MLSLFFSRSLFSHSNIYTTYFCWWRFFVYVFHSFSYTLFICDILKDVHAVAKSIKFAAHLFRCSNNLCRYAIFDLYTRISSLFWKKNEKKKGKKYKFYCAFLLSTFRSRWNDDSVTLLHYMYEYIL